MSTVEAVLFLTPPPTCATCARDLCPIFRIFLPLLHKLYICYHRAKIALILSESPLPYLPISLNCSPPRMAGLSAAQFNCSSPGPKSHSISLPGQTIKFEAFFHWLLAFKQHNTNQNIHANLLISNKIFHTTVE